MHDRDRLRLAQPEFHPNPTSATWHLGHVNLGQEFVSGAGRLAEAGEEVGDCDRAPHDCIAIPPLEHHAGAERHEGTDRVVRRASCDQIASQRRPIAQLGRADFEACLGERQRMIHDPLITNDLVVGDTAADQERLIAFEDL